MPKPPLIASESARASVIAVVMLVLLVASLGLAYGLVVLPAPAKYDLTPGDPQHVGDLTVNVPQGWRATDLGQGFEKFRTAKRFADRHNATRQMIVGELLLTQPQDTLHVLGYLVVTMLGRADSRSVVAGPAIHPLKAKTGQWYTDAITTKQGVEERFLAVMTVDGSRHWVIFLSQFVETPALLKQRILADDQAFERICESASLPKDNGTVGAQLPGAGGGATTKHDEETP